MSENRKSASLTPVSAGPVRERTQKGTLIAGQAFVEAYHFEKSQNWVGIAVAPSVLRQFPELGTQWDLPAHLAGQVTWEPEDRLRSAMAVQPCHAIPWHAEASRGKDTLEGFAVAALTGVETRRAAGKTSSS